MNEAEYAEYRAEALSRIANVQHQATLDIIAAKKAYERTKYDRPAGE